MALSKQHRNLARFFQETGRRPFNRALLFAIISTAASFGVLFIVSRAEFPAPGSEPVDGSWWFLVFFAMFVTVYIGFKWFSFVHANRLAEQMVTDFRTRIIDKLSRTELRFVEELDRGEVYSKLSSDTGQLSHGLFRVMYNMQDTPPLVICFFCLALVSPVALCLSLFGVICVFFIHSLGAEVSADALRKAKISEGGLLNALHSLFYGFKEIKLNAQRDDDLFATLCERTVESKNHRAHANLLVYRRLLYSDSFIFVMLGVAIFVLPQYTLINSTALLKVVALLIFAILPIGALTHALSFATYVDAILGHMYELEDHVDEELASTPFPLPIEKESLYRDFREIACEGLRFSYRDAQGKATFSLGPLNLSVRRGETLFLVGGNGAGKSTAFKLLTGLYQPDEGAILVDGNPVPWSMIARYRQLFAAVFGDFYLFDRLYGMADVDETRVAELLHFMQLERKVRFADGQFSTQSLSTGQRKRLALITALLEDREIYLLDEWAADQDRHFREYFYRTVLPDLKRRGKTVMAITHDDQYFDAADRVLRLDYGQLDRSEVG